MCISAYSYHFFWSLGYLSFALPCQVGMCASAWRVCAGKQRRQSMCLGLVEVRELWHTANVCCAMPEL